MYKVRCSDKIINKHKVLNKEISKQKWKKQCTLYGVSPRFFITKIRLRSVNSEKRKIGISVIDLTDEVKYLRLMVIQLYFFSFGISYLLNEG